MFEQIKWEEDASPVKTESKPNLKNKFEVMKIKLNLSIQEFPSGSSV